MTEDVRPWELVRTDVCFDGAPWVRVHKDAVKLPGGRVVPDYYRVDFPEYAMVYARGKNDAVLCLYQYKHALRENTITLPTGCIEPGEAPLTAAKRELREETGYEAGRWQPMGTYFVDGNKGCGRAHFFIADDLNKVSEPVEDDMEVSRILFLTPAELDARIADGTIRILGTVALIALVKAGIRG